VSDFEALAKRFAQSKTKNIELEQLKAAIRRQLERMIRVNRTRADFSLIWPLSLAQWTCSLKRKCFWRGVVSCHAAKIKGNGGSQPLPLRLLFFNLS